MLALMLAYAVLPPVGETYVDAIWGLVPLLEAALLAYATLRARAVVRHFRTVRASSEYPSDALEASLRAVLGNSRLLPLLVTELSMPYYLVAGWFSTYRSANPHNVALTYHRRSGYGAVIAMFGFVIAIETVGLH